MEEVRRATQSLMRVSQAMARQSALDPPNAGRAAEQYLGVAEPLQKF
jgi:hypothetical protein